MMPVGIILGFDLALNRVSYARDVCLILVEIQLVRWERDGWNSLHSAVLSAARPAEIFIGYAVDFEGLRDDTV